MALGKNDLVAYTGEYISLIGQNYSTIVKNESKLKSVKFIYNEKLNTGNVTAYAVPDGDSNIIVYGNQAEKHDIFHELEHIRKSTFMHGKGFNPVVLPNLANGGVRILRPQKRMFFEEGTSEFMAKYMMAKAQGVKEGYTYKAFIQEYDAGEVPYGNNVAIIFKIAALLDKSPLEICKLIEKRNSDGDKQLETLFKNITGDPDALDMLENNLDYYHSWYSQETAAIRSSDPSVKPDERTKKIAENCLKQADDYLTELIESKKQLQPEVYESMKRGKIEPIKGKKVGFFKKLFRKIIGFFTGNAMAADALQANSRVLPHKAIYSVSDELIIGTNENGAADKLGEETSLNDLKEKNAQEDGKSQDDKTQDEEVHELVERAERDGTIVSLDDSLSEEEKEKLNQPQI